MLVTVQEVNTWFNKTVENLSLDDLLRESDLAQEYIIGKLKTRFDTSEWTTSSNTPTLVKTCIAMLIAAWRYRVLYTETTDENMFANTLENRVNKTIMGMMDGSIAVGTEIKQQLEFFFPNDTTKPIFSLDMEF